MEKRFRGLRFVSILVFAVFLMLLSACSSEQPNSTGNENGGQNQTDDANGNNSGDTQPEKQEEPPEPATVVVYSYWQEFSDEYWNTVLVNPVKEKFPHITVEVVKPKEGNGTKTLEEMIVASEAPDMVVSDIGTAPAIADLGFNYDMLQKIEGSDMDLSKLDANAIEYIKALGEGKLVTMPYSSNFIALFYNKDIFDRFGQEYPRLGVTFDEVLELARNMTRVEEGQKYIGFDHNSLHFLAGGITRDYFDPETGKANVSTPEWRLAYDLLVKIIDIPNNRFPGDSDQKISRWHNEAFYRDQYVAMSGIPNIISAGLQTVPDFNWDMTSYPVFEGYPKTAQAAGGRGLFINPGSKVLDAAFNVVETVVSEDVQMVISKNGEQPIMMNDNTIAVFAENLPYTKGKNVQAAFYNAQNYPKNPTIYDGYALSIAYRHSLDLYQGKDINTVIRETEEEIDQYVAAQESMK